MPTNKPMMIFLSLLASTLLVSCKGISVKIKNTEACAVAGTLDNGMMCGETLTDKKRSMLFGEMIKFLEPQEEVKDNQGNILVPKKGPAICQSIGDWNYMKTTLEQICVLVGENCSYEIKEVIKNLNKVTEEITGDFMIEIKSIPKQGDVGRDVTALQKQLHSLGHDCGVIDGVFGGKTKKAIQELQKKNGLEGSGVIGPKTLEILKLKVVPSSPVTGNNAITKDLVGKKKRFLHPSLRLMIESEVFVNGIIPDCFNEKDVPACVVKVAQALDSLGIKEEGGNNKGQEVGYIQSIIGSYVENGTGDAWCMSTVQCVVAFIEDFFQVESPLPDTEGVMDCYTKAKDIPGLVTNKCEVGSFFLWQNGTGWQGHTGIVLSHSNTTMNTFEGNTGAGSIRDGDGAFTRVRLIGNNGKYKIKGFARVYPDNKVV